MTKEEKKDVGILAIIGYTLFVIVACLLVGLLPPFVNRPTCKENSNRLLGHQKEPFPSSNKTTGLLERVNKRIQDKNLTVAEEVSLKEPFRSIQNFSKNTKTFKSRESKKNSKNIFERFKNANTENPARTSFFKQKVKNPNKKLSICPEIENPTIGEFYPWYNERLPDYTIPTKYDIELFVPEWIVPIFDGFIEITIKLTQPTNYLLLHSRVDILIFNQLLDAKGQEINVECLGEVVGDDYLVVKSDRMIQPSEGPLRVSFYVIDILTSGIESGIFEISFEEAGKQSKLLASKFEPISAREA